MLMLSRNVGETLLIEDGIEVTLLSVHDNGRVRLGIKAPHNVQVRREESEKRTPTRIWNRQSHTADRGA